MIYTFYIHHVYILHAFYEVFLYILCTQYTCFTHVSDMFWTCSGKVLEVENDFFPKSVGDVWAMFWHHRWCLRRGGKI